MLGDGRIHTPLIMQCVRPSERTLHDSIFAALNRLTFFWRSGSEVSSCVITGGAGPEANLTAGASFPSETLLAAVFMLVLNFDGLRVDDALKVGLLIPDSRSRMASEMGLTESSAFVSA